MEKTGAEAHAVEGAPTDAMELAMRLRECLRDEWKAVEERDWNKLATTLREKEDIIAGLETCERTAGEPRAAELAGLLKELADEQAKNVERLREETAAVRGELDDLRRRRGAIRIYAAGRTVDGSSYLNGRA